MAPQPNVIDSETFLGDGMSVTHRVVQRGNDVLEFTHQLWIYWEERFLPIERYDCAHGFPHRDTLNADGSA